MKGVSDSGQVRYIDLARPVLRATMFFTMIRDRSACKSAVCCLDLSIESLISKPKTQQGMTWIFGITGRLSLLQSPSPFLTYMVHLKESCLARAERSGNCTTSSARSINLPRASYLTY